MIDRRNAIAGLVGLMFSAQRNARAQSAPRRPVIGFVLPNVPVAEMIGADPVSPLVRGFVHGLRDLGWIEGQSVSFEWRSAEGDPSRAPALLSELVARRVDVIVVGGSRWLQDAARRATDTIPILALFSSDPVATGLIKSLAQPGGNLTGVMFVTGAEFAEKQLQFLQEAAPGVTRVALIGVRSVVEHHRRLAERRRVTVVPARVDAVGEYDAAFELIRRERADALLVAGGPPNVVNARRLADFAVVSGLPALFGFREAVEAGGLMSYGPSFVGVFRQQARLVGKFLDGARIGEVPTELPTTFELVVNMKTAKSLGLTIPPSILVRADEVIE